MREQISFSSLLKTALIREGSTLEDNARWIELSSAGVSKEGNNEPGVHGGGLVGLLAYHFRRERL